MEHGNLAYSRSNENVSMSWFVYVCTLQHRFCECRSSIHCFAVKCISNLAFRDFQDTHRRDHLAYWHDSDNFFGIRYLEKHKRFHRWGCSEKATLTKDDGRGHSYCTTSPTNSWQRYYLTSDATFCSLLVLALDVNFFHGSSRRFSSVPLSSTFCISSQWKNNKISDAKRGYSFEMSRMAVSIL